MHHKWLPNSRTKSKNKEKWQLTNASILQTKCAEHQICQVMLGIQRWTSSTWRLSSCGLYCGMGDRRQTLNKECKCDEVDKREMFGVLRTCSEGINSRGTLLRPGREVREPNWKREIWTEMWKRCSSYSGQDGWEEHPRQREWLVQRVEVMKTTLCPVYKEQKEGWLRGSGEGGWDPQIGNSIGSHIQNFEIYPICGVKALTSFKQ